MTTHRDSTQPLYFVNGVVDFLLIGGISILTFFGIALFHTGEETTTILLVTTILLAIFNWPHFSATNYRLYQSRHHMRQYPLTSFLVPVVLLAGLVASFASPYWIAVGLVKLYLIWAPYHGTGQSFGLCMLYARRDGLKMTTWERRTVWMFLICTMLHVQVQFEASTVPASYYGIACAPLGLPSWLIQVTSIAICCTGVLLAGVYIRWCATQRRLVPPIIMLPVVTQLVWFVFATKTPAFRELFVIFHGMQYMLVAWVMQMKESMDSRGATPSVRFVFGQSCVWMAINLAGGLFIFWILPRACASAWQVPLMFASGVVFAGIQIHHYVVDGVIWKLQHKSVSSPLMVSLSQLVRSPKALSTGTSM